MRNEEVGRRIEVMRTFLKGILTIAYYFDPEGISIRFLNHNKVYDYIRDETLIDNILRDVPFRGCTQIGTQLRKTILDPIVLQPAKKGCLKKPVLVTIITDGHVSLEEMAFRKFCSFQADIASVADV
jgi:hypothetical protein